MKQLIVTSSGNEMAGPTTVASPLLRLAVSLIVALGLPMPPVAASNVLLSGESLGAGAGLAHGSHSFVMRSDCDLWLDDGVWQAGTAGRGSSCRVALEADGRLIVSSEAGATVWTTPTKSDRRGEYAAVLDPRGRVTVYGPAVWSAADLGDHRLRRTLGCLKGGQWDNCLVVEGEHLLNSGGRRVRTGRGGHPRLRCLHGGKWDNCIINSAGRTAQNVLFSGVSWFGLRGGCGGVDCFLRLDSRGGLAVVDEDEQRVVWSNGVRSAQGEYVAVLRGDGVVAVYGPAVWSTADGAAAADHYREAITSVINRKIGEGIKTVIMERE